VLFAIANGMSFPASQLNHQSRRFHEHILDRYRHVAANVL